MWFFGCSCAFTLGLPLELIKIHVMVAKLMSHCSSMYYTNQSESRIYYYLVVQFLLLQLDITRTHEKTVTATHMSLPLGFWWRYCPSLCSIGTKEWICICTAGCWGWSNPPQLSTLHSHSWSCKNWISSVSELTVLWPTGDNFVTTLIAWCFTGQLTTSFGGFLSILTWKKMMAILLST